MEFSTVSKAWENYLAQEIDRNVHSEDDMFRKSPRGWDDYEWVGRSGAECVLPGLLASPIRKVTSVLDYGCGHGRVARHLRALFPKAEMSFCDIDASAAEFCAATFSGDALPASDEFDELNLGRSFDLIFVGSVFSHTDWRRSRALWHALVSALNADGVLVATFRGAACYREMVARPLELNAGGYYQQLLESYIDHGFGYQDYKGFRDWGQNLWSLAAYERLTGTPPLARLVSFTAAGYGNVQDAVAWTTLK